jgi:hypothetical protein
VGVTGREVGVGRLGITGSCVGEARILIVRVTGGYSVGVAGGAIGVAVLHPMTITLIKPQKISGRQPQYLIRSLSLVIPYGDGIILQFGL